MKIMHIILVLSVLLLPFSGCDSIIKNRGTPGKWSVTVSSAEFISNLSSIEFPVCDLDISLELESESYNSIVLIDSQLWYVDEFVQGSPRLLFFQNKPFIINAIDNFEIDSELLGNTNLSIIFNTRNSPNDHSRAIFVPYSASGEYSIAMNEVYYKTSSGKAIYNPEFVCMQVSTDEVGVLRFTIIIEPVE